MKAINPHNPIRPTWRCGGCTAEWPCLPAKILLLAEFAGRRIHLRMTLGAYFSDALMDLTEGTERNSRDLYEALHKRFFGWLTRASNAAQR